MISIEKFGHRDYGRFGNQLFQYSLAKILATYHNCNFYLNPSDHFLQFFDTKSLTYKSITTELKTQRYSETDAYYYDNKIFDYNNIDLLGFFQNLSYYDKFLDILNKEFIPNANIIKNTIKYLRHKTQYTLDLEQSICIHVRRTDYTILQQTYGILDMQYYINIINNYIHKYKHIFIISDDINQVKYEASKYDTIGKVYFIDDLDIYHDFYIMYLCGINVLANSTFSWWAAILSSLSYSKRIYAPYPWLNRNYVPRSYYESINLYPNSWNKIGSDTFKWDKLFI